MCPPHPQSYNHGRLDVVGFFKLSDLSRGPEAAHDRHVDIYVGTAESVMFVSWGNTGGKRTQEDVTQPLWLLFISVDCLESIFDYLDGLV